MAFHIETDHVSEELLGDSYTGRTFDKPMELRYGPFVEELAMPDKDDAGKELPRIAFRLFDDDGELYYEGWLHDDWNADNQSTALHWAQSDAGCTTIKVKRGNEWKQEIG